MPDVKSSFNVAAEGSDRVGNTGPPYCSRLWMSQVRLIVLVEGINDIAFLNRLSRTLHQANSCLPDLAMLESDGTVLFIPVGGSDLPVWERRFSGLGLPEFHLYDRDVAPTSAARLETVEAINTRPNARAMLTRKRQLESYLHSDAIHAARGIHMSVGDDHDVPEIAARACYRPVDGQPMHRSCHFLPKTVPSSLPLPNSKEIHHAVQSRTLPLRSTRPCHPRRLQ